MNYLYYLLPIIPFIITVRSTLSLLAKSGLCFFTTVLGKGSSFHLILFSRIILFTYDCRYGVYTGPHFRSVFILMDFGYDIIKLVSERVGFIIMKVRFDNTLNVLLIV